MNVVETSLTLAIDQQAKAADLIAAFGKAVANNIDPGRQVVRFVITGQSQGEFQCELGVFESSAEKDKPPLFAFRQRNECDHSTFNAVFLVPTGIGAEIGGHSGDSGPVARLLASVCDTLITQG